MGRRGTNDKTKTNVAEQRLQLQKQMLIMLWRRSRRGTSSKSSTGASKTVGLPIPNSRKEGQMGSFDSLLVVLNVAF